MKFKRGSETRAAGGPTETRMSAVEDLKHKVKNLRDMIRLSGTEPALNQGRDSNRSSAATVATDMSLSPSDGPNTAESCEADGYGDERTSQTSNSSDQESKGPRLSSSATPPPSLDPVEASHLQPLRDNLRSRILGEPRSDITVDTSRIRKQMETVRKRLLETTIDFPTVEMPELEIAEAGPYVPSEEGSESVPRPLRQRSVFDFEEFNSNTSEYAEKVKVPDFYGLRMDSQDVVVIQL